MTDRSVRCAIQLLIAIWLVAMAPAVDARRSTLLQRLRELIGINPRQAVGGSRGSRSMSVCLITPRLVGSRTTSSPTAVVSLPRPTLLIAGELNEVRLEQDGQVLWQQRASSTRPITGPIAWPLPSLQPGERMLLRLRPRGAAGGDFADVQLRAASANQQQEALALLTDPSARFQIIDSVASKGRYGLASELVFAPLPDPPKDLEILRQTLISAGCSGS